MKKWLAAHRKGVLAALTAVLILVVDQQIVDVVIGVAGVALTLLVGNDQEAVAEIYGE